MYFEINGKTLGVKFRYIGTTTVAELVEVSDKGIIHLGIFGIASLYYKDTFQKKIGRKVALTNLLSMLSEYNTEFPEFALDKESRTKIWEAYFHYVGERK